MSTYAKHAVLIAMVCGLTVAAWAAGPTSAPANDKSAATAPAEAQQAKVVSVTGRAQKLVATGGADKWQDLRAGDMLDAKTIIRTGLRTRVVLKFQDRAEVVVEDATKVGISEFLRRGEKVQTQLGLKYGSIKVDVPKSKNPTDFSVSTPVATLSIRGTAGDINFHADSGLHLHSWRGFWTVAGGNRHRNVGAGEDTTGTLIPNLELVEYNQNTFQGDFFGGVDPAERSFLINNGTGRGVIVITNNPGTNNQTTPGGSSGGSGGSIHVPGGDIDIGDDYTPPSGGMSPYSRGAGKTSGKTSGK